MTFEANKNTILDRLAEGMTEQMDMGDMREYLYEYLYEDYQTRDEAAILETCQQWGIEIDDLMGDAPPPTIADKLEDLKRCPMTEKDREILDEAAQLLRTHFLETE